MYLYNMSIKSIIVLSHLYNVYFLMATLLLIPPNFLILTLDIQAPPEVRWLHVFLRGSKYFSSADKMLHETGIFTQPFPTLKVLCHFSDLGKFPRTQTIAVHPQKTKMEP